MIIRKLAWILIAAMAALVALSPARPAFAQAKKIEDMNRLAMEDYDILEFESAKKQLNDALLQIKRNKLDDQPVAARTHLLLGIVYGGGLNDVSQALVEFSTALQIDPKIQLDAAYRSPELEKIFDQAKATVGTSGGSTGGSNAVKPPQGGGDEGVDDNTEVMGLVHTPIDQIFAGEPVKVRCKVGADVKAKQVVLYHRGAGAEAFTPVVMKNTKGVTYEGMIPAAATNGDSLHYYIEARNAQGRVNASNGNSGSPNIVTVEKRVTASATGGGSGGDAGEKGVTPDRSLDDEDPLNRGGGRGIEMDDGAGVGMRVSKPRGKVFFAVMAGTGVGLVTGKTESYPTPVSPGLASAPFHVQPQLGYYLNPKLLVSIIGRIGFPMGATVVGHSRLGPAGLARLAYSFDRRGEGLFLHGDVGGGFIRQTVEIQNGAQAGKVDTYATGPLLVGGGAGYRLKVGGPLSLVGEVNVLVGIPVVQEIGNANPEFGVNADATLGFAFAF